MDFYELPKIELPKIQVSKMKIPRPSFLLNKFLWFFVLSIFSSSLFGFLAGVISSRYYYFDSISLTPRLGAESLFSQKQVSENTNQEYIPQTSQEQAIIKVVKDASPSVVSIIITKNVPIMEQYYTNPFGDVPDIFGQPFNIEVPQFRQKGTEKKEIGGGTGFIVSSDGMILTNKHVVSEKDAEYTVFTNDGKSFPAKVLATDPVQDLAILKIEQGSITSVPFPVVKLGDSSKLQIGQTVITIGNALGEFRNTVSAGVVSGLGRTITASGGAGEMVETLEDVIQTDAAINKGNSGGPLLNLNGEVIGINTAMAEGAQSIGFAIPVNKAKRDIDQVKAEGKIVYPFLGVRYILVNEQVKTEKNLSVDYGALILKGDQGEVAITPGSAAEKAGLKENDVILELNGEKISKDNSLANIIMKYSPGDKVTLKLLREKEEKTISVVLGERSE